MSQKSRRKPVFRKEKDFEVYTSSIPKIGRGLFAKVKVYPEDTIGNYLGKVLTDEQFYSERKYYLGSYNVWVCRDCWIWGEGKEANYVRYINHSSNRFNAELVTSVRWKKARIKAIRIIYPGDEIFMNYGDDYWENIEAEKVDY